MAVSLDLSGAAAGARSEGGAVSRFRSSIGVSVGAVAALLLTGVLTQPVGAHPEGPAHHNPMPAHATKVMRAFAADQQGPTSATALSDKPCTDGYAGGFPCDNVDLLSYLPLSKIGGTRSNSAANDIWGWTDPDTKREYAIVGRVFGTSFVDITEPTAPVYLGNLPTHGPFGSSWRDIKVYKDHAFIVSEAKNHGMQVFDLTQLGGVTAPPVQFAETAHYNKVSTAHNIAINEASGFAYVVGASGRNGCSGGLHMVDIDNPLAPSFEGCYSGDGYTHDTQCVNYAGPDGGYRGKEICFNSNEDTLTIVDVSTKSKPTLISRTTYEGAAYTHQGWLTEDQAYFLLDDELDERNGPHDTLTRVFDVSDLDTKPAVVHKFFNEGVPAIDHNQYVHQGFAYQANYRAGLRVLDARERDPFALKQVGYFDIYPDDDKAEFNGAWSTYPYFPSGVVVVSGIEQGLFVLDPQDALAPSTE
jgi:choice-of-anchor B domain-containing protein